MQVRKVLVVLCLCVLGSTVSKKAKQKNENLEDTYGALLDENVQNDDYDYGIDVESPTDENNEPTADTDEHVEFITQPGLFVAKIGDTLKLPCEVSNPGIVMVWQRDDVLIFQSQVPMDKLPNIQEFENGTLEVTVQSDKDYGNYACVLITSNDVKSRPRIIHHVVPPTPPKIQMIKTEGNRTEFKAGEALKMTCIASGYPKPLISWHKGNERLDIQGPNLIIPSLKVSDKGIYRCLADNHVQKPAHHHISINIEHEPQITVGEYLVTSNKERDAELTCTVDAYPEARIYWKKGNFTLKNEGNHNITVHRRQNTVESVLVISNVAEEDITTYTCLAKNRFGKSEETVTLVKIPVVREFVKPASSSSKDVTLTWKVESKSPISTHEIHYKKKGDTDWKMASPEVTNAEKDIYTVTYTLKDLETGEYETRVRSKNEHGWSEFSDIMPFEGVSAKHGSSNHKNHQKKLHKKIDSTERHVTPVQEATSAPQQQEIIQKEASVGASKPGSSTSVKSSTAILSIALILLFSIRQ